MEPQSKTQMTEFSPKKRITEGGIAFSVAIVLYVVVAFIFQLIAIAAGGAGASETDWYKYLALLLPQLCFAGAALLFFRRSKNALSPREVYAPCKWWYFLLALALQFGLLFALGELNGLFLKLLERLGYTASDSSVTDSMVAGWGLLPAILIIALLPAIFEETLFRGILSGSMKNSAWGTAATVLVCGALFSLFHGNPEQTIYQFICGACYTLLAIRAGSILPTVLAHFVNNAAVLIMGAVKGVAWTMPLTASIVLGCIAGVMLIGVMTYLIFFDKKSNQKGGIKEGKAFFLSSAVGIVLCAALWISTLVMGITA